MTAAHRLLERSVDFNLKAQCTWATAEANRFAAAWHRWRGERLIPRRSDIELADIKSLLAMVILGEARSPDEFVFRVFGSRLRDYIGMDLTSFNYIDMAEPEIRDRRRWRVSQQIGLPCGSLYMYPHRFPSGHVVLGEAIALPVAPDREDGFPMMLCAVIPMSTHQEDFPDSPRPQLRPADQFAFVDIGAGVPDRTGP